MTLIAKNHHLDAVIFDLDGTLIDSIDVYIRILNSALRRIDVPEAPRHRVLDAIREGGFDWNRVLVDMEDRQKELIIKSAMAVISDIYEKTFLKEVTLIPGADVLLKDLSVRGIRIGLVTSTQTRFMEYKLYPLRRAGIYELIEAIITTDDVRNRKPSAEPLIECGKRLSVEPGKMAYVGDTVLDIRAGKAAGTLTVAVLTGVDDYESLRAEGPDAIMDSVDGLRDLFMAPP